MAQEEGRRGVAASELDLLSQKQQAAQKRRQVLTQQTCMHCPVQLPGCQASQPGVAMHDSSWPQA